MMLAESSLASLNIDNQLIREDTGLGRVAGSSFVTGSTACPMPGDVSPVPWPIQGGGCSGKHRRHSSVATVKMFKDFLSEDGGNDRPVVEENHWTNNHKG